MNSPIVWFGGKGTIKKWVLERLAVYPHRIYVEPFGGGASVLLAKEPAPVEVYNDLDGGLVDLFRVLSGQNLFRRFKRAVAVLPSSRKLYYDFRGEIAKEKDLVARAVKWYYVARLSFAGNFGGSWGYTVTQSTRGMAACCARWLGAIDGLPAIHDRLRRVQIENLSGLEIIAKYDTPDTLFYLDPPYVLGTRVGGKTYRHEMTDADHEALVAKLLTIQGSACLSGYEHPIYQPLLDAGWQVDKREVACMAVGRTRAAKLIGKGTVKAKHLRTECLYMSPKR